MSYLLDALKQSQQADMSAEQYDLQSAQLKQQQALTRYKKMVWLLGGAIAAFIAIAGGFTAGKWFQSSALLKISQPVDVVSTDSKKQKQAVTDEPTTAQNKAEKPVTSTSSEAEKNSNKATIEGQLVYVQTPTGVQKMLLTPQGQYIPINDNPAQQQPGYNVQTPINANGYNQNAFNQQTYNAHGQNTQFMQPQAQNTSSAGLDMSKYKVLGKPLNGENTPHTQAPQSSPELDAVPSKLKDAFAQAIKDSEQEQDYEVTQASRSSSRVKPVELLPDGLQAMLPSIKYQAHIYSSSADKRWIKLNGRELHEGESIGALTVREITPEQSVLDFDGYEFSIKALQDWPQ